MCYIWDVDWSRPHSVLLPRIEGAVITVLAGTTHPLSGREVARIAGTSVNGAWRALRRFVEHGLVIQQEAGSGAALLYTLNRDHLAADAVFVLASLRDRFFHRVNEALGGWSKQPFHASVFGSAARGDGDTASDVDFFLVRSDDTAEDDQAWRAQIDQLADDVRRWTGNHAGIVEASRSDLRRLARDQPPIIEELERDAVILLGPSVAELLRQGPR